MSLANRDYLTFKIDEKGEKIYHIKTPCRFIIKENVVEELRSNYTPKEEIGGIIWVNPIENNGSFEFISEKISFVRNAIEDSPNKNGRTRRNTYRPDKEEYLKILNEVFQANQLPIHFHTHPTEGNDFMNEFLKFSIKRETSEQDKKVSKFPFKLGNEKLLLPRGLVVGNDKIGDNIFIGVYNGFIAPKAFEETKKEVMQENMKNIADTISEIKLTRNQKIGLALGALLLLAVIIRYRKYSIPAILTMGALIPSQLTNTGKKPKYYNQLRKGDAIIEIPEYEEKIDEGK